MLGLHRALPILAFVTACGSGAAAIGDPTPDMPQPDGGGPTVSDPSSADDASTTRDGATDAPKGKPTPDASGTDAAPDAPTLDAGLCPDNTQTFTMWTLTDGNCLYVKGGSCMPTKNGGGPDCSKLVPCGCQMVCAFGGTSAPFWTSDNGDVTRTPYTNAGGSPGTCP